MPPDPGLHLNYCYKFINWECSQNFATTEVLNESFQSEHGDQSSKSQELTINNTADSNNIESIAKLIQIKINIILNKHEIKLDSAKNTIGQHTSLILSCFSLTLEDAGCFLLHITSIQGN